jgi:hypothetical protein
MPQGAAHDLAQDVAAALVGRQHAVVNQERSRARVVGGDAEGGIGAVGRVELHARQLRLSG